MTSTSHARTPSLFISHAAPPCLGRLAAIVLLAGCLGCGPDVPEGPDTTPVRGKIVFTKGGQVKDLYDTQGAIEFESLDSPGVRAIGAIEEDGSFTLATIVGDGGKPGAVAGRHRVRLNLDETAQRLVAPKFLSFERSGLTVTVPPPGDLVISVSR